MSQEYIIPTKENLVFTADCNMFGYLANSKYKRAQIENGIFDVFATDFTEAFIELHKAIKDLYKDSPKAKWSIYVVNGQTDEYDFISKKVYTITTKKFIELNLHI